MINRKLKTDRALYVQRRSFAPRHSEHMQFSLIQAHTYTGTCIRFCCILLHLNVAIYLNTRTQNGHRTLAKTIGITGLSTANQNVFISVFFARRLELSTKRYVNKDIPHVERVRLCGTGGTTRFHGKGGNNLSINGIETQISTREVVKPDEEPVRATILFWYLRTLICYIYMQTILCCVLLCSHPHIHLLVFLLNNK